jgi:DNA-binding response OmpR family regulator
MPELRPTTLDRILIIEGNGTLQKILHELFSSEGYEVDLPQMAWLVWRCFAKAGPRQ